jgi:4-amino-4-deoxy-L-arabinose transferase-like glycosyltransferase
MKKLKLLSLILLSLFVLGAVVRSLKLGYPVSVHSPETWREADVAAIARNFYHESMNLFYPRIDWRGDGPGFAEMEFPLYPWLIAVLYKVFGYHEIIGRLLSYSFSLGAMAVFFALARYLLPPLATVVASVFFVLSPVAIHISTSLQPEGMMFLFYGIAAYTFIRWLDTNSWKDYTLSLVSTTLAILAKPTSAHLGLFFALSILRRKGLAGLRDLQLWVFAVGALLPSIAWYIHARQFWLTYGNSLGLSNKYHWIGWDILTNHSWVDLYLGGMLRSELIYVWLPTSVGIILFSIFFRKSERIVQYSLYWLVAIFLYYILAIRTLGDGSALYYHVVSLPPVALLFGMGVETALRLRSASRFAIVLTMLLGIVGAVLSGVLTGLIHTRTFSILDTPIDFQFALFLALPMFWLAVFCLSRLNIWQQNASKDHLPWLKTTTVSYVGCFLLATLLLSANGIQHDLRVVPRQIVLRQCAEEFKSVLPPEALLLVSGGVCTDPTGHPVAHNTSYMFYWTDHKGFNICHDEQSLAAIRAIAARGAKYYIAEKVALEKKPGFEADLRREFPVIKECEKALLIDLAHPLKAISRQ